MVAQFSELPDPGRRPRRPAGRRRRWRAADVPRKACGHTSETDPCFECFYEANRQDFTRWAARQCDRRGVLDLSQDVFNEAVEKLFAKWKREPPDNPRAYMYTVLETKAVDAALRRGVAKGAPHRGDVPLEAAHDVASGGPDPESEVLRAEWWDDLRAAVEALPVRQREVAARRYLMDLSPAEIAGQLGIASSAVSSALDRGNHKLRTAVDPHPLPIPDDCGAPRHPDGGEKE